jgi:hypothetical protein
LNNILTAPISSVIIVSTNCCSEIGLAENRCHQPRFLSVALMLPVVSALTVVGGATLIILGLLGLAIAVLLALRHAPLGALDGGSRKSAEPRMRPRFKSS